MALSKRKMASEDWAALRFDVGQMFTPSTPIGVAEMLAGRQNELSRLLDAVAERGRHILIYGEPGVGKTSASQTLQYFVPRKTSFVRYIRRAAFSNDNYSTIWMDVFRNIQFKADAGDGVREYNLADLYRNGVTASDVVRELSNFSENDIPIIVIDEFNVIKDDYSSKQMAETIKAVSDASLNVTLVIVGISDTIGALIQGHESIARCTEEVLMPRMLGSELQALIELRFGRLGMTIEGDAKWKVINLSKGLPAFVHSLGKGAALSAISERRLNVEESDVDKAIDDVISSSQNTLKNDYEMAIMSNQARARFKQIITACAMSRSDERGYFTPKQVQEPLTSILKKPIGIDGFNPNLKELASDKRGNVLQQIGSERIFRYRFRNPAMQPYVIMKGIKEGFLDEAAMSALSSPEQGELFASAS